MLYPRRYSSYFVNVSIGILIQDVTLQRWRNGVSQ
jgi:hypothetical protein